MAAGASSSCWVGLQPLKSTFPFQLQSRRNGDGDWAANVPYAAGPEKVSRNKRPRIQRPSSLDTILGSYLMGQWPRDTEGLPMSNMCDKSTQVLEVPDGHRAPIPFQRNTEDYLLPRPENNSSPCSSLSLSPSPSDALQQSSPSPTQMITDEDLPGFLAKLNLENKGIENGSLSPVPSFALSPRPNHTFVFKREPPEGCEKIHTSEELVPNQLVLPSCPDKNKVYFKPTGSAFCQFSLLKPLIPKVNIPNRDFSSSPSPKSSGTFSSCQPPNAIPIHTLQKDLRGDDFSENPKSPSLDLESWKRHQPEDTALFHSSVAV